MFSFRKWISARMTPGAHSNDQSDSRRRSDLLANGSASSLPTGASPFHLRLADDFDSIVAGGFNQLAVHSVAGRSSNRSGNFTRPTHAMDLTVIHFYRADAELNQITAELDSFEGKNEPVRCTHLVNQLRSAQDKVICLLFQMMDECECDRTSRDYRLKFPDDLVVGGENGESLNGQIWFGAECLGSGSNIMNHEVESETLRPLAKKLTQSMQQIRSEIRYRLLNMDSMNYNNQPSLIIKSMAPKLEAFDQLFTHFEYEYVSAMLPIKTAEEIERLHELTVLFSEAVARSLRKGLISQEDIDECHPHVLIAIPRLAIIYGLVHCQESPILRSAKDGKQSHIFRPYYNLLSRVRELINALRPIEVQVLERMLTNEESVSLFHGDTDTLKSFANQQEHLNTVNAVNSADDNDDADEGTRDTIASNTNCNTESRNSSTTTTSTAASQVARVCHVSTGSYASGYTSAVTPHFNVPNVHTRSPVTSPTRGQVHQGDGSTPSTSVGSCKTDDSNSYPLSSSTCTSVTSGSTRRVSPSPFRRRRHSDPTQFLSATVARKSAFNEKNTAIYNATHNRMTRAPSTLSLTTTIKEKQNRLSKMSFCTVDPKIYRNRSSASSSSCPVTHNTDNSTGGSTGAGKLMFRGRIPASRSFAPDRPINCQMSPVYKSSRGNASTRPRAYTLGSSDNTCSTLNQHNNNNNNRNESNHGNQESHRNTCMYSGKTISSISLDSTTSSDSADSFELALAVAAKSGYWISPGTRHLLHRLFVKIAGVADRLQSNHATDLRTILRAVFKMHSTVEVEGDDEKSTTSSSSSSSSCDGKTADSSDSCDDVSVEEALEAREESSQTSSSPGAGASGVSSSSSSSSIVNKDAHDDTLLLLVSSEPSPQLRRRSLSPAPQSSSNDNPVNGHRTQASSVFAHVPHVTTNSSSQCLLLSSSTAAVSLQQQKPQSLVPPCCSSSSSHHQRISGPMISNSSHHNCSHYQSDNNCHMPLSSPSTGSLAGAASSCSAPCSAVDAQRHPRRLEAAVMDISSSSSSPHVSLIPPHHPNHQYQRHHRLYIQQQLMAQNGPQVDPSSPFIPPAVNNVDIDDINYDQQSLAMESNNWINHHNPSSASSHIASVTLDVPYLPPIWIPDELVDSCSSCTLSFNLLRRRHHCRHCGLIYCNNCSSHSVPLSHFGYTKPVRVCDDCFISLANPFNSLQPVDSSSSPPPPPPPQTHHLMHPHHHYHHHSSRPLEQVNGHYGHHHHHNHQPIHFYPHDNVDGNLLDHNDHVDHFIDTTLALAHRSSQQHVPPQNTAPLLLSPPPPSAAPMPHPQPPTSSSSSVSSSSTFTNHNSSSSARSTVAFNSSPQASHVVL